MLRFLPPYINLRYWRIHLTQITHLKQKVVQKLVVTVEFVTVTRHRNGVLEWVWKGGNSARRCNIYPSTFDCFFGVRGEERCKGVCNISLPTFKTVNMVSYVHEQGNGAFTLTFQVANLLSFPFAMHCQNTKIGLKSINWIFRTIQVLNARHNQPQWKRADV